MICFSCFKTVKYIYTGGTETTQATEWRREYRAPLTPLYLGVSILYCFIIHENAVKNANLPFGGPFWVCQDCQRGPADRPFQRDAPCFPSLTPLQDARTPHPIDLHA